MEHTTRYCDLLVKKRSKSEPHGVAVEDNEPTVFIVGGVQYTADLCAEHRQALVDAVQPFIDVSQSAKPATPPRRRDARGRLVHRTGPVAFTSKDVRLWLQGQGREVPASGRIAKSLIEEYEQAHR